MSPAVQMQMIFRKDNLQNISEAFKNWFDKVSVRMHRENSKSYLVRRSLSVNKAQKVSKNRNKEISLSHRRKNSIFSQTSPQSPTKHMKTENFHFKQPKLSIPSTSMKPLPLTSYHFYSPSFNKSEIYSKIASYNELLITKTYVLEDSSLQKISKDVKEQKLQRRTPVNEHSVKQITENKPNYESRIKNKQKNRGLHTFQKRQSILSKKIDKPKAAEFEPWETDRPQQYFFIAQ